MMRIRTLIVALALATACCTFDPAFAQRPAPNAEFIFIDSDARLLSVDDVSGLTGQQLWQARNEILARRGYIFETPRALSFFRRFSYYRPLTRDVALSEVERANIALISRAERSDSFGAAREEPRPTRTPQPGLPSQENSGPTEREAQQPSRANPPDSDRSPPSIASRNSSELAEARDAASKAVAELGLVRSSLQREIQQLSLRLDETSDRERKAIAAAHMQSREHERQIAILQQRIDDHERSLRAGVQDQAAREAQIQARTQNQTSEHQRQLLALTREGEERTRQSRQQMDDQSVQISRLSANLAQEREASSRQIAALEVGIANEIHARISSETEARSVRLQRNIFAGSAIALLVVMAGLGGISYRRRSHASDPAGGPTPISAEREAEAHRARREVVREADVSNQPSAQSSARAVADERGDGNESGDGHAASEVTEPRHGSSPTRPNAVRGSNPLSKAGAITALVGAVLSICAALATLFLGGLFGALFDDRAISHGFGIPGLITAVSSTVLASIMLSGPGSLVTPFLLVFTAGTGIVFGGTWVAATMALVAIGGVLGLFSKPPRRLIDVPWQIAAAMVYCACVASVCYQLNAKFASPKETSRAPSREQILNATVAQISPRGRTAEMFSSSVSSTVTDVQRQNYFLQLRGQVVEWRLPVWQVSRRGDGYVIQTTSSDGYVGTFCRIRTPAPEERRFIESLSSGQFVVCRGIISDTTMRNLDLDHAIAIQPR